MEKIRRLVVRYDRSLKIYRAFFISACFMIVSQRVLLLPVLASVLIAVSAVLSLVTTISIYREGAF